MITLTSLDRYQQAVVNSSANSIRVVAPAGSGKTETLSLRVQQRIGQGVPPHRILLLTFDNNARNAISQRLTALQVPSGVRVSTLNAFGFHLLNTRFADERRQIIRDVYFPQSKVLNDLVQEYGHSVFTEMLSKIKNEAINVRIIEQTDLARWCAKNRMHLLRNLEDDPILEDMTDARFGREIAREMELYERFLEERNGIDFDDQKLRPLIRLQDDSSALDWLQAQFDDVIVDEFQDINRLDVMLIDLVAARNNLMITGDDDQAIYGFRGATADFLIDPTKQLHREFESYELSINYRCPPRILDVASKLIAWNEDRIDKSPRAHKNDPGEIDVHGATDTEAETTWIAKRMKELLTQKPMSAAVLARRRVQLVGIQSAFIRNGTPYKVSQAEDIRISWSLARRALTLAPLSIRAMPEEEIRAEIVRIFCEARAMQPRRVEHLVRLARQNDLAFPGPDLLQQFFDRDQRALSDGIKALAGEMPLSTRIRLLDALLNTELRTYMEGGKDAARDRSDVEKSRLSGLSDLAAGLSQSALIERIDELLQPQRQALRQNAAVVELSTCHGAKGREWQLVCIPHCNQGVFPDSRSDSGEHLEAERKLFYVSMTRASEHLMMTWSKDRNGGARGEPSNFLIEAGLEKPRQKARTSGITTWSVNQNTGSMTMSTARNLSPDGTWAMSAPPKKVTGPPPRNLTLVTPRGRSMQNAVDMESTRMLADAIQMQHIDRNIAFGSMTVKYPRTDVAATIPLQVELGIRGIPFAINEEEKLGDSSVYKSAKRAWEADAPARVEKQDSPLIDALASILERLTESGDSWVWLDRLESLEDMDIGSDPAGVQFSPQ